MNLPPDAARPPHTGKTVEIESLASQRHGSKGMGSLGHPTFLDSAALGFADSSAALIASACESIKPRSHAREYSNSPRCSLALASAFTPSAFSAGGIA